jgi:hypothetical protein
MQEPLIIKALETGAIFPEQCCPSPTHGYVGALGLAITEDMQGDMNAILKAIDEAIVAKGGAGRFGTWMVPFNMVAVEAGVEIARAAVEKGLDFAEMDAVGEIFGEVAGGDVTIDRLEGNFYLLTAPSVVFGVTEL